MKFPTFSLVGLVLSQTCLAKIITEYREDGSISLVKMTRDGPPILNKARGNDPRNDCNQDNCYRALDGRLAAASTFCPTFTTQVIKETTSLSPFQTFCANNPSRVSSACSPTDLRNQDNCYRALDGRLPIAHKFCPTFTAGVVTATTDLGPFQALCAINPSRISSACSCLIAPSPTTTSSISSTSTSTTSSESTTTITTSTPSPISPALPGPTCGAPGAPCRFESFTDDCCWVDGMVSCNFPDVLDPVASVFRRGEVGRLIF